MSIIAGQPATAADVKALFTVETGTSAPYSLTTVANQKVVVIVKGSLTCTGAGSVNLLYNGVTKDSVSANAFGTNTVFPFTLMYTETPGAAVQNITLTGSSVANLVIIIMKSINP